MVLGTISSVVQEHNFSSLCFQRAACSSLASLASSLTLLHRFQVLHWTGKFQLLKTQNPTTLTNQTHPISTALFYWRYLTDQRRKLRCVKHSSSTLLGSWKAPDVSVLENKTSAVMSPTERKPETSTERVRNLKNARVRREDWRKWCSLSYVREELKELKTKRKGIMYSQCLWWKEQEAWDPDWSQGDIVLYKKCFSGGKRALAVEQDIQTGVKLASSEGETAPHHCHQLCV